MTWAYVRQFKALSELRKNWPNTPELTKKHLEYTKGKIFTRFPPEPNGYLHIGHCKSIRFNFSLAKVNGDGHTNLRFDDTNPENEDRRFMEGIKDTLTW